MSAKRKFYFGDVFKEGVYQPLHKDLFDEKAPDSWSRWLVPSFAEISKAADEEKAGDLRALLREEVRGVYSFDLFTPEFCDRLLAEVEHAEVTSREALERPNGMNRYGIVLNQLGLEPIITSLQQKYLMKLQAALFPDEGFDADDHHCFIVRYRAGEDLGLDMHEDDSDVTLNVCLGRQFTQATLSFCGLACDDDHRQLKHTYAHAKGRAVIHRGRHRHGADNIETGERINFILWSTSEKYRKSEAYHRHRLRSLSATPPERICLSYTHDKDYTAYLDAPSEEDALKRGVMLDHVKKRTQQAARPVHDMAKPLAEINEVPSVCLFMEGMPPQLQHSLFGDFMNVAMQVRSRCAEQELASPLFFIAAQSVGAVPQIRSICNLQPVSPVLVLLDVDKSTCYRYDEPISLEGMKDFVGKFLQGSLTGEALREPGSGAKDEPDTA